MRAAALAGQDDLQLLGGVDMTSAPPQAAPAFGDPFGSSDDFGAPPAAAAAPPPAAAPTIDPQALTGIVNLDNLNLSAKAATPF